MEAGDRRQRHLAGGDTTAAEHVPAAAPKQHFLLQQHSSIGTQDASTCSTRDLLHSNTLAPLFRPAPAQQHKGSSPNNGGSSSTIAPTDSLTSGAAVAAAAAAAGPARQLSSSSLLANLTDTRELQLVAAAFAAGAAAGASGQLQAGMPLLEQFSSGDISCHAVESSAPTRSTASRAAVAVAAAAASAAVASGRLQSQGSLVTAAPAKGRQGGAAGGHKSSYRGVFWDRKNNRWRSQVGHNNRKIFMGYFTDPAEAARTYDKKLVQLKGTLAKTNFPLQLYPDDLRLHKELRTREDGDELLLLPLDELQAHLQQHLQELLPKQPGLKKVYSDWEKHRQDSDSHTTQPMMAQQDELQDADSGGTRAASLPSQGPATGAEAEASGHSDWPAAAQAAGAEAGSQSQPASSLPPALLDQQWSTTLPAQPQPSQPQQRQPQQAQQLQQPAPGQPAGLPTAQLLHMPGQSVAFLLIKPAAGKAVLQPVQLQLQSASSQPQPQAQLQQLPGRQLAPATVPKPSSHSGAAAAAAAAAAAGGSGSIQRSLPSRTPSTLAAAAAAAAAAGGSSKSSGARAAAASSGSSGTKQLRDSSKTLQQHLLTRLHERSVHRSNSGASMDALLAAAAVLEEEEEVAATLCGQLHEAVSIASPAQDQQPQPPHPPPEGQMLEAAGATAAAPTASQEVMVAAAAAAARAAAAQAAAAAIKAYTARARSQADGACGPSPMQGVVVTDPAAVVAAILASPDFRQQQQGAAAMEVDGDQPAEQQLPPLDALQRQVLQPPSTEQQVVQMIQLAHRAGLNKEGQHLLLLVVYHQLLERQRQQEQSVQAPANIAQGPAAVKSLVRKRDGLEQAQPAQQQQEQQPEAGQSPQQQASRPEPVQERPAKRACMEPAAAQGC